MPESREEKLARIKREIAAGTYCTEAKMREALKRMARDVEIGLARRLPAAPHDPWCACPICVGV